MSKSCLLVIMCCLHNTIALAQDEVGPSAKQWLSALQYRQGIDSANSVEWKQSPVPAWLQRRSGAFAKQDLVRDAIQVTVHAEYSQMKLKDVLRDIATQCGTRIHINSTELDLIGLSPDVKITFGPTDGPAERVLRQVLDPLELKVVHRIDGLLVTSQDDAQASPVNRYYNMAWVLPTGGQAKSLVDAIELTIDPDSWLSAGGTSRIQLVGSIMVVSAPDSTQAKIEDLYANLLRVQAAAKPTIGEAKRTVGEE